MRKIYHYMAIKKNKVPLWNHTQNILLSEKQHNME